MPRHIAVSGAEVRKFNVDRSVPEIDLKPGVSAYRRPVLVRFESAYLPEPNGCAGNWIMPGRGSINTSTRRKISLRPAQICDALLDERSE